MSKFGRFASLFSCMILLDTADILIDHSKCFFFLPLHYLSEFLISALKLLDRVVDHQK